jgi:hypothetical protein
MARSEATKRECLETRSESKVHLLVEKKEMWWDDIVACGWSTTGGEVIVATSIELPEHVDCLS